MNKNLLILRQLDTQLKGCGDKNCFLRPKQGWVRVLRKALGMTIKQLAQRLGVDPSRVVRIETDELKEATTLRTLASVAEAFDCTLIYAFVPKASLEQTVMQQATKMANNQVKHISHTMDLEAQSVNKEAIQAQIQELRDELLRKPWKYLWEE